jgi:peptidoglycan/LPS O-acetylase OafA/YrhL
VIAYSAERTGGAGRFAFDRATRLLSVVAPALLLTLALDRIGARLDPEAYDGWWHAPMPAWEMLLRGLSFTNEWSGTAARLGTNGPLWSLSYEATYYLAFGVATFLAGARRAALLILLALLAGLPILLLAPCWLLGVLVWRAVAGGRAARLSPAVAILLAAGAPAAYAMALSADLPGLLRVVTAALTAPSAPGEVLRFSDEFLWNWLISGLAALHLLGMARLVAGVRDVPGEGAVRWWAGASFSLYVAHYPLLQVLDAALGGGGPVRDGVLLAGTLAGCLLFAALFERPLGRIRAAIQGFAARPAGAGRVRSR